MKMARWLELLSCEDSLRHLGLLSLEKKSLWTDLIETFQYLKGAYEKKNNFLQRLVVTGQERTF